MSTTIAKRTAIQNSQFTQDTYYYHLSSSIMTAFVFVCNMVVFILMSVCLFDAHWITSDGFRQGLLYLCIDEPDGYSKFRNQPLPFNLSKSELEPGCYPNRDIMYLKICTILCLLTILSSLASAFLAVFNLRVKISKRIIYIKLATCTVIVAIICNVSLLIIYPTQFRSEIEHSNRDVWELNHAYGLAVGTAIVSTISLLLLITKMSGLYRYNSPPVAL